MDPTNKKTMKGKVVVSVFSILLVVGVAIGCVALISKGNQEILTPQAKAVTNICQPTSYKDECTKSLSNANSLDPKELIKVAVVATQQAVKKAHNFTDGVITQKLAGKDDKDSTKKALEYCKQMLDSGVEDLQDFLDVVGNKDNNLSDKFYDLWSWVSSTFAYQQSCLDDIMEEDLKKLMNEGMLDAKKLTSNAMAIVKNMNDILSNFGLKLNFTLTSTAPTSRRLLQTGHDGFPTWLSGANRKLLAAGGGVNNAAIRPNAVVAQDGSGQFKTIAAALTFYNPPKKGAGQGRYIIYVKAGVYREQITIKKNQVNVFIYGDGPRKTIITNNKNFGIMKIRTSETGTLRVFGAGFMAKWIGIRNTAGPVGEQAVALQIQGDKSVIFNCRLDGFQDTLYTNAGRQFYRNCVISGTVDFIFGRSPAIIQNSLIIVRKGNNGQKNTVTADGKEDNNQLGGIVIQNCRIVPDMKLSAVKLTTKSFLGRPWKQFSTTVIMDSQIGDFIGPEGWMIWEGKNFHTTCHYKEFRNKGPGARNDKRVNWVQIVTDLRQIMGFTAQNFLGLGREPWLAGTGVPFLLGL